MGLPMQIQHPRIEAGARVFLCFQPPSHFIYTNPDGFKLPSTVLTYIPMIDNITRVFYPDFSPELIIT